MKFSHLFIILLMATVQCSTTASISMKNGNKEYKFLQGNTIYGYKGKELGELELNPIFLEEVYRPDYFYDKTQNLFIVRAGVSPQKYLKFDTQGNLLETISPGYCFSEESGIHFGVDAYVDWENSSDVVPYTKIINADLTLDNKAWFKTFRPLYEASKEVEYVDFRGTKGEENYWMAVAFRTAEGWVLLCANDRVDNAMYRNIYVEPQILGIRSSKYGNNQIDYPMKRKSNLLKLKPLVKNQFHYRSARNSTASLKVNKYQTKVSAGWHTIAKIGIIPLGVLEQKRGVACMKLKYRNESFYFKIGGVEKSVFSRKANIGVNVYHLPPEYADASKLMFVESISNSNIQRSGQGVYLIKAKTD